MTTQTEYLAQILRTADTFEGAKEHSKNDGPEIRLFLSTLGRKLDPVQWCAITVGGIFYLAAQRLRLTCDVKHSSGAVRMFHRNPEHQIQWHELGKLTPGCSFHRVRDKANTAKCRKPDGDAEGHAGILVEYLGDNLWKTFEGNTAPSNENDDGDGAYYKTIDVTDPRIVGFLKPTGTAEK